MAKSFGELLPGILARTEAMMGFQEMLRRCPNNSERKNLIMDARLRGALSHDDATLLIQAHMLETD